MKNVRNTLCTLLLSSFCTLGSQHWSGIKENRRSKKFGNIPERTKAMPLIKKAPAIVALEVKVKEPVKQLLEDYARFIESRPDHVVNSVIKRNLWRDQDYRKWGKQHRAQPPDSPKSTASPRG